MKMEGAGQQNSRMQDELTRLGQRLDKVVPVHIVEEDVVGLVATAHEVIQAPWYWTGIRRGIQRFKERG